MFGCRFASPVKLFRGPIMSLRLEVNTLLNRPTTHVKRSSWWLCAARAKRLRTPCRCVISCTARQQVCRRNAGIKFGPNPSEIKTETSCSEGSTVAHAELPDGYLSVLISDFVFLCIQRQRGNFANASSCFKLVSDGLCSFRKRVELLRS